MSVLVLGRGDIQGPPILNLCINLAAQRTESSKVLTHGAVLQRLATASQEEVTVLDTDYADDMALMDSTKDGLQETTDLLCKYAAQAGLRINVRKTEVMAVAKNTSQRPYTEEGTVDISVEGSLVQQVSNFTYLGVVISSDGSMDRELSARIWKASGAFNQLSNIWKNRNIQTNTKIRIYKAAVLTILLYGSEVWNTIKKQHHVGWKYFISAASGGYSESSGIIAQGTLTYWNVLGSTRSKPMSAPTVCVGLDMSLGCQTHGCLSIF